jgi:hypothetical protein
VGKVQHFGNAVNHGIAQCDNGIYSANADAIDQVLQETHDYFLSFFQQSMTTVFPEAALIDCCKVSNNKAGRTEDFLCPAANLNPIQAIIPRQRRCRSQ